MYICGALGGHGGVCAGFFDCRGSRAMSNTMTHKGLTARVEFSAEDGLFVGRLIGVEDAVGFHADTVDGLRGGCGRGWRRRQAPEVAARIAPPSSRNGELRRSEEHTSELQSPLNL